MFRLAMLLVGDPNAAARVIEAVVDSLEPPLPAKVSADKEEADIWFVNMTPGWHITTVPAAIFYHPASTASGNYRATARIHLFDPKGRNEAFGLFFGGKNLDSDSQSYDYFLIRNSGEFLIKRRAGKETPIIRGWTKSDQIRRWTAGETSVLNDLSVECDRDVVRLSINGEVVATLPRSEIQPDGIVGLRVNHRLNLHVEDLSVETID